MLPKGLDAHYLLKVLLVGSSSWIGDYLYRALTCLDSVTVTGIHHKAQPNNGIISEALENSEPKALIAMIAELKPHAVILLSRGETEGAFELHQKLTLYCLQKKIHYTTLSSFNALDGNLCTPHSESESPNAQSDYGKFKARCETYLQDHSQEFCIIRFAAIHGWAANRTARTESFLNLLKAGETVKFNPGIVQNRLSVFKLSEMIAALVVKRSYGVFHLGTVDASTEVLFHQMLAEAFGYAKLLVVPGEFSECNAVMVPDRILELFPGRFRVTEKETVAWVRAQPELAGYVNENTGRS